MSKKRRILIGVGIGIAVFAVGYFVGERALIEKLIRLEMGNRPAKQCPAVKSLSGHYGNLIFEIKAECVGD